MKIAVIGGGPSGLAAVYEFINTTTGEGCSFADEIVGFEAKSHLGGVWDGQCTNKSKIGLPPQRILDRGNYSNPKALYEQRKLSLDLLRDTNLNNPLKLQHDNDLFQETFDTAAYPRLFSNVSVPHMSFSYMRKYDYDENRLIDPFLTCDQLNQRIKDLVDDYHLEKYYRMNSCIEKCYKKGKKWVLVVKRWGEKDEWYQEEFDRVCVATGHTTIPYIPQIEGLSAHNAQFPGTVLHGKYFEHEDTYKGQTVIVVGGSFSALDLVQYLAPACKVIVSKNPDSKGILPWFQEAFSSSGLETKPQIKRFIPGEKAVEFVDGTTAHFDTLFLTTGYHSHYPFLSEEYIKVLDTGDMGVTPNSKVDGLYLQTFCKSDPTLGFVGICTNVIFSTIEMHAMMLAAVWSGKREIPSLAERNASEAQRKEFLGQEANTGRYHVYLPGAEMENYINECIPLTAREVSFLEMDSIKHLFAVQSEKQKELFYLIKDKHVTVEETLV